MSDLYDGQATLRIGDDERVVRVRLAGQIEPIDGRYHWRGTVFDALPEFAKLPQPVTLSVGDNSAEARITERTPQGGHSVSGVGAPPFTLS
jgi:predicted Zn-dependent protease